MASLHSLPEHLVGVLYSLLPDLDSRRAFLSCSAAVRRSPSVLSRITELSISAQELKECHSMNPLACLPRGVRLLSLHLEFNKETPSLMNLFQPAEESTRTRVQDTLSNLQMLRISERYLREEQDKSPFTPKDPHAALKESLAVGACLAQLPLSKLRLDHVLPSDASSLLRAMSVPGPSVQSLRSFSYKPSEDKHQEMQGAVNAAVSALAPFQNLEEVALEFPARDLLPLAMLPKLWDLDVGCLFWFGYESACNVLQQLSVLKVLRASVLPFPDRFEASLTSGSLERLVLGEVWSVGQLVAVLNCAVQGLLPRLRVLELGRMPLYDTWSQSAHQQGVALATVLAKLPHLSFNVPDDTLECGDALLEFLSLVPALGHSIKTLNFQSRNVPSVRVKELPSICPNLTSLTWSGRHTEDLLQLVPIVRALGGLQRLNVKVNASSYTPGIAAGILAFSVQCACLERAERVCIKVSPSPEYFYEPVDRELQLLRVSWPQTQSMLQSSGFPCRVAVDVTCPEEN